MCRVTVVSIDVGAALSVLLVDGAPTVSGPMVLKVSVQATIRDEFTDPSGADDPNIYQGTRLVTSFAVNANVVDPPGVGARVRLCVSLLALCGGVYRWVCHPGDLRWSTTALTPFHPPPCTRPFHHAPPPLPPLPSTQQAFSRGVAAVITVAAGVTTHTVYALNDNVCDPCDPDLVTVQPGNRVTVKYTHTIPTSDFTYLEFTLTLPPLANGNDFVSFVNTVRCGRLWPFFFFFFLWRSFTPPFPPSILAMVRPDHDDASFGGICALWRGQHLRGSAAVRARAVGGVDRAPG